MIIEALNSVADLAPTILLSATPSVKASVAALQTGAKDYLALPASSSDLMAAIERATAYSVRKPVVASEPVEMLGSSEIMDTLRQRIAKIGPTDSPVLILGQSGTGKELVAAASTQPATDPTHRSYSQLCDGAAKPHRIRIVWFSGL